MADDRVSFARPEAAAEVQRASRRARQNPGAEAGLLDQPPNGSAPGRPEQPVHATRVRDIEVERSLRASTGEQSAAPPFSSTRDETGVPTLAMGETGISDHRKLRGASDDLAAPKPSIATRRTGADVRDHGGPDAKSEANARMGVPPIAEQRHRFDVRSPREEMLTGSLARREQEPRSDERGRTDGWVRAAEHARQLHSDRNTRPAEPVIQVSIGRIEVRASSPAAAPRVAERRHSPMTIEDYVARGRAR